MGITLHCPVKINLTLHILNRRADGYHELRSAFWKKSGNETLNIEKCAANSITVEGAKIEGKNLLSTVLEFASARNKIPQLCIKLCKKYPQGSGIGAGSGNAAALLAWLKENARLEYTAEEVAKLGADVAVLTQENMLHYATGVGEKLTALPDIEGLSWLLIFPKWHSNTAAAYAKLDEARKNAVIEACDYFDEAKSLVQKLKAHKQVGLLPNDFLTATMAEHEEYAQAFEIGKQHGALAWGMCGSGSAMFFISEQKNVLNKICDCLSGKSWVALSERLD